MSDLEETSKFIITSIFLPLYCTLYFSLITQYSVFIKKYYNLMKLQICTYIKIEAIIRKLISFAYDIYLNIIRSLFHTFDY